MIDTYSTLVQIENIFQALVASMLGLDPNVGVRIAWTAGSAPAYGINDDIAFIRVIEVDDDYNRIRDVSNTTNNDGTINQAMGYTRVLQVDFTVVGPNSFDNAAILKDQMLYDETLPNSNLYLIPDIPAPMRAPELFDGQWWPRTDITMKFNELIIRNTTISSVDNVVITTQNNVSNETTDTISIELD